MSAKINLKKAREIVNEQIIQNKVEELPNKAARDREIYANKLREEEQQAQQAQRQQQQRQSVVFNNRPTYNQVSTNRNVADAMKQGYAYKQNTNALGQNTEIQNTLLKGQTKSKINLAGSNESPAEKQKMREKTKKDAEDYIREHAPQMVSADSVNDEGKKYVSKLSKKTKISEEKLVKYLSDYNQGKWKTTDAKYREVSQKLEKAGYKVQDAVKEINKYGSMLGEAKGGKLEQGVATATDFTLNVGEGALSTLEGLTDTGEYLFARKLDLLGADKAAEKVRSYANMNATKAIFGENEKEEENFKKGWTEGIKNNSLLDDTGRNVAQGVGNTLAFATLAYVGGAAGIPSGVTTNTSVALSSYGNTKSNMLASGYDDSTATKTAIINSLSEVISENIFDFKFGMNTVGWGDKIVNGLTNSMEGTSGRIFRRILEASSEGAEELISNFLNMSFSDLTNLIDPTYDYGTGDPFKEFTNQESWEAFFSATLSTMLVNSGSSAIQKYVSKSEKKQIIQEYADNNNISFEDAKKELTTSVDKILNKVNKENALNVIKELMNLGISHKKAFEMVNENLAEKNLPNISVIKSEQDSGKVDSLVNFYGIEMTEKDINKKINEINNLILTGGITDTASIERLVDAGQNLMYALDELGNIRKENSINELTDIYDKEMSQKQIEKRMNEIDAALQDETLSDEAKNKLNDAYTSLNNALDEFQEQDTKTEEIAPAEEQDAEVQEEVNIDEKRNELEDLRAKKEENDKKVAQLNEQLNKLRENKKEQISSAQLDRRISKQRLAIEQLQDKINREKANFGVGATTGRMEIELVNAKNRLESLQEQKRNFKEDTTDTTTEINKIKKQIDQLNNNTFNQDISDLENEIDSLEQIEEPEVSEDTVSGDEIGADIEGIDEEIEVEGPEYAEVLEKMPYEEETFREKLTEDLENSKIKHAERMTKYVTRYYPFQELANKTKNNTLLPALHQKDSSWSQAQSDIAHVQRDLNGNVVGEGLDSLYAPIEQSGKANLFDTYMYASRQATQSLDREMVLADKKDIARVKEIDKTRDKLMKESSDLTAEELKDLLQQVKELDEEKQELKKKAQEQMKEFVKETEEENPEFKEWKQNILKYEKNLRNMLVESGVMSKKTSETFEQINPEYVRIYRDVHGKNANPLEYSEGKIKVSSPIKQTKGSTQDILPLKEALARQTLEVRQSATSNVFGQELYKILGGKGSKINRELINNNIITGANNTYGYVFYKNGKQITVPVNSVMKMALENTKMTKEDLAGKAIRKLSNLQRDMITGLSPIFTIKNVPKDFFDATINTKYPKTFLLNYGKAWANMISSSDTWKTYMAMGGDTINRFDYQKGFVNDTLLTAKDGTTIMKKALKSPIQMMRFISEHAEQVTRFAEFMNSLSNGENVQQAMYNAAEVTTNFGKGGTVTSKASRLGFNYFNASILGGYKAFENVKNHKGGKQFIKYAVQMAAFGILPALANSMLYKDDDEYKQLSDDVKDKNYVFKIGEHDFLKIPKGRLSSVISYYLQRIMEGRSSNLWEFKDFTLDQIGPSNPLTGNIYYPIYNVLTNGNLAKNFWDSNIVPTRYAGQTLQEQWKDSGITSLGRNLSKGLHQIGINISPFLIDYLYDNYSGFVGDITKPFMTKQADKNVLDTLFVVDTITNNKDLNDMYNLYDKYAYPTNEEDLIKYKYMNSQITKTYDKYAEIRKIQRNDDLTDDEKRTQVNAIREELNELAREAVGTVKNEQIKNVTVDGITYKRLRDALFKYDEEEGKWTKVNTHSKEYKNVVE